MVGTGKGAENGILIKSAEALETLHTIQTVVLEQDGHPHPKQDDCGGLFLRPGGGAAGFSCGSVCLRAGHSVQRRQEVGEKITGDPTETAFLRACKRGKGELEGCYPRVGRFPSPLPESG